MESNWYYRKNAVEFGPITILELQRFADLGQLTPTDFVRHGNEGPWRPAAMELEIFRSLPDFQTAANLRFTTSVSPPTPQPIPSKSMLPWTLGAAVFAAVWIGGVILMSVAGVSNARVKQPAEALEPNSKVNWGSPATAAEIEISGEDATEELISIVAAMSEEQRLQMGQFVLTTGQDFYGARVRITNQSDRPIRINPENIRLHLNGESARVLPTRDPRFLQAIILQPGYYVDGLIAYRAALEAGAAMRSGAGNISYVPDAIESSR